MNVGVAASVPVGVAVSVVVGMGVALNVFVRVRVPVIVRVSVRVRVPVIVRVSVDVGVGVGVGTTQIPTFASAASPLRPEPVTATKRTRDTEAENSSASDVQGLPEAVCCCPVRRHTSVHTPPVLVSSARYPICGENRGIKNMQDPELTNPKNWLTRVTAWTPVSKIERCTPEPGNC